MIHSAAGCLIRELEGWVAPTAQQEALRLEYLAFVVDQSAAALRRDGGCAHITASCFIFSFNLELTLLCFHRKGHFWVQTGGHVEPEDTSIQAAALREAREEGGITALSPVPDLLDLDRHALSVGFGHCRTHWNVGVAALAPSNEPPQVSDESEQVAWFPVDNLPTPLANSVAMRIDRFRSTMYAT